MSEDEKLLKEAKKLPWEDRLLHKNWKVRNDGNLDLAALCDSITDPKDPRLRNFGPLFIKTVADSNAHVQEKALDALILYLKAGDADVVGRYVKEVCDSIVAKCFNGCPKTVEKSQAVFLLWVELEATDVFLDSMEKAIKAKVAKAVVPAIDVMFQALSDFGTKVVPPKRILKMLPELLDHQDQSVRASSKGLMLELCRWIGKDSVKSILFEKLHAILKKELEAELVNVTEGARPTRKIRSEQDKEPESEAASKVDVRFQKTTKGSERKEAVAELTQVTDSGSVNLSQFNLRRLRRHGTTGTYIKGICFLFVGSDGMTSIEDLNTGICERISFRTRKLVNFEHAGVYGAFAGPMEHFNEIEAYLEATLKRNSTLDDVKNTLQGLTNAETLEMYLDTITDLDVVQKQELKEDLQNPILDYVFGNFENGKPRVQKMERSSGEQFFFDNPKDANGKVEYLTNGDGAALANRILEQMLLKGDLDPVAAKRWTEMSLAYAAVLNAYTGGSYSYYCIQCKDDGTKLVEGQRSIQILPDLWDLHKNCIMAITECHDFDQLDSLAKYRWIHGHVKPPNENWWSDKKDEGENWWSDKKDEGKIKRYSKDSWKQLVVRQKR